ncbi:hypothetical protein HF313_10525 [Massilia atriviolacea]|uniref:Uncharacterized protein n=1 Tax=Massilia atriviolacea TaxID=2495579 RepID=A0A430HHY0_9BURK|nr:hypothetical protein [Massilia atriviolacea]RSZ57116.1 hypothetical protein EJB06_20530 [Massilia atriviolacea]
MKKNIVNFCAALSMSIVSSFAAAQYADVDGRYTSDSIHLQIIVLNPESGDVAATTSVITGACSGNIAGLGKVSGNKLSFSPYVKEAGAESCVVHVEFDGNRKRAKISAAGVCSAYHGGGCGWEGKTTLKKSR